LRERTRRDGRTPMRPRLGRIALGAALAALALATAGPAAAQRAPWCAWYDVSTVNCGFYSRAQCLAAISGVGGWCTRGRLGPQAFGSLHGSDYPRRAPWRHPHRSRW
jgi:hypothetical protein